MAFHVPSKIKEGESFPDVDSYLQIIFWNVIPTIQKRKKVH